MAGIKSREETIREEMDAPLKIDTNVEIRIPKTNQITQKKYKCLCCGASWDTQKSHFSKSADVLWQSNDGYIPICNSCRDAYYYKLVDLFSGNESHAIEYFCRQFGWVFDIEGLKAAKQISADRSRISHYGAKKNLGQVANIGTTYFDSIKYHYAQKQNEIITSREQAKSEESTISASAVDRWGIGFTEMDYKNLDEHWRMLKKNNPNADSNQEIFIRDLCNINMLKIHALQNGDSKEYATLVEQYSKTFKQAGLKTIEEKDNSNNETIGVTLATISQFTPEEFYKDKKLYEDYDEIGDYFERHVCRPMENIMTGSEIRDKEFYVPENGGDDDE